MIGYNLGRRSIVAFAQRELMAAQWHTLIDVGHEACYGRGPMLCLSRSVKTISHKSVTSRTTESR